MRVSPTPKCHLSTHTRNANPLCPICNQRVPLEESNTDEHGLAVHEECYVLKLRLKRASSESLPEPTRRLSLVYSNRNRVKVMGQRNEKGFALCKP
jgi:hypothetical protein